MTYRPKSKTLQSMGWFPSGKLVILAREGEKEEVDVMKEFIEWQSRHVFNEEEFGYNKPATVTSNVVSASTETAVQWTGGTDDTHIAEVKPTDIFTAVQTRFDDEQPNQHQTAKTQQHKKKRTEKQRHDRLDNILRNLKSNNKTSVKVRTMLIKSRAVGNKQLRMEDRFHLETVRIDDTVEEESGNKSEFRFYSRQSTAGKVASSVAPSLGQDRAAELLVAVSCGEKKKYRRLPSTISLHDAEQGGWLNEFDMVLIRIYSIHITSGDTKVGPTKSVCDAESDCESITEDSSGNNMEVETHENDAISRVSSTEPTNDSTKNIPSQVTNINIQQKIQSIFQLAEAGDITNPNKPKKKKTVSKQVQNMIMKSKAKGNTKVKQEDRVYLEIIVFQDSDAEVLASSLCASYWFFEKRKTVEFIIESLDLSNNYEVEIIVQPNNANTSSNDGTFQTLPPEKTISDAMKDGLLSNFDHVILRLY